MVNVSRRHITVPNIVTIVGLAMVMIGCTRITSLPWLLIVFAGRGFDLADGYIARRFHQESALGAALDATADKLATLAILVGSTYFSLLPVTYILYVGLSQLCIVIIALRSANKRSLISVNKLGKYHMLADTCGLFLFMLSGLSEGLVSGVSFDFGIICTAVSIYLLGPVLVSYFKQYKHGSQPRAS